MTNPGNPATVADMANTGAAVTGFDKIFNPVDEGITDLMKDNLRKINQLEEKNALRNKIIEDLNRDMELTRTPKGFALPKKPQVPNSVQEEFDSLYHDLESRFLTEVIKKMIQVRKQDLILFSNDLDQLKQDYRKKYVEIGLAACKSLGASENELAFVTPKLDLPSTNPLAESSRKTQLTMVFDTLKKEKKAADKEKAIATRTDDMQQQHDTVSTLVKKVASLEKRIKNPDQKAKRKLNPPKHGQASNSKPPKPKNTPKPKNPKLNPPKTRGNSKWW